ncbi:unnamed protein product [Miscanthus lutarioriparius]|uniref:F-box domain-containing protein n=1 Tax=Miscanthus lutarioriparius TaxID=422564 RepID=A0A811PDD3_9POAL|nr:unnamed protein product [Miscanthus lutarioriparius]
MSASVDPLDALPAVVLADVLGRVADAGDIAACRLASRALLAASYLCPRVRLCAADRGRRRREGGGGSPAFRATTANLASLLGPHLRSLSLDTADGQGSPDDAMCRCGWRRGSSTRPTTCTSPAARPWRRGRPPPRQRFSGSLRSLTTGRRRAGERRRRSHSSHTTVCEFHSDCHLMCLPSAFD